MTSTETNTTSTPFTEAPTTTYQDQALAAKSDYRAKTDAINKNPRLTPEGKREALAKLHEDTSARVAEAQAAQQKHHEQRKRDLADKMFKHPVRSDDPALAMSYRDASDRVSHLVGQPDGELRALTLLRIAIQNDDAPMERCLLRAAYEQRWPEVVNAYTAERSHHYDAAEELWRLTDPHGDTTQDLINAMAFEFN